MSPLMNLLARNHSRNVFRYQKDNEESSTIYLYSTLVADDYWGGVTPLTVANALAEIETPELHLRINSPGGDVFAGRAIEQLFREYEGKLIAHIDGYAASAASFVALAAEERKVATGGFFMIHKGWTIGVGNADDFAKTTALLNKIDSSLAKTYERRLAGVEQAQIVDWMKEEKWFDAEESMKHGFATSIVDGNDDVPKDSIDWDVSCYRHGPGCDVDSVSEPSSGGGDSDPPNSFKISAEEYESLKRRFKFLSVVQQY